MEPTINSSPTDSLESLPVSIAAEEMKNDKFKITLDSPNNTYYSGQTVRGTISLINKQVKKIRGIYFRIVGYGKCNWTDLLQRETTNDGTKGDRSAIQIHSGSEKYLNSIVYVIGAKNGPTFSLNDGTLTYDFSFQLKRCLPSSFSGIHGKIKYKMEFVIDRPWKFDEKQQIVLTIIQLKDVTTVPNGLEPLERQITRTIGYIGSGPIAMHVLIPKIFYVASEKLPIQVMLQNNSRVNIEKVKFGIYKTITYISGTHMRKHEVQKILKKEAGGVNKKTEQNYQHTIDIPAATPTQNDDVSQIIHINYELKIEAKLSGLYKNLLTSLPFTIGNVPACGNVAMPLPATTNPVTIPCGPPYPTAQLHDIARPLGFNFNNLSITSSPSHSTIGADNTSMTNGSPVSTISRASHSISSSITSTSMNASYPPSAPPFELSSMDLSYNSTFSDNSLRIDAPPSYDEVFGGASSSQMHSSSFHESAGKT